MKTRVFILGAVAVFVLLAGLFGGVIFYFSGSKNAVGITSQELYVPSLVELVSMSAEELDKMDVALVNLVCAEGLYGAENLDIRACIRQIDEWL